MLNEKSVIYLMDFLVYLQCKKSPPREPPEATFGWLLWMVKILVIG